MDVYATHMCGVQRDVHLHERIACRWTLVPLLGAPENAAESRLAVMSSSIAATPLTLLLLSKHF